jgi:type II secretory pathway pseudopilin PulG
MPVKRTLKTSGFTIMETLIVLAVAGLFMLLTLKAIPALQRSSRNDQRKQGVQTILQAVSNYELNHSGTVPTQVDLRTFLNNYEKDNMGYYVTGNVVVIPTPNDGAHHDVPKPDGADTGDKDSTDTGHDQVVVANHAKCNANNSGASNDGASYSDIVALYYIEAGGSYSVRCQQL